MITFNCPKCKDSLSVPDSQQGLTEQCPSCKNVCSVPAVEMTAAPKATQVSKDFKTVPVQRVPIRTSPTGTESTFNVLGWVIFSLGIIVMCLGAIAAILFKHDTSASNSDTMYVNLNENMATSCLISGFVVGLGLTLSSIWFFGAKLTLEYLRRLTDHAEQRL